MPKLTTFEVVYFETIRISHRVKAASVAGAIIKSEKIKTGDWRGSAEHTLVADGVEQVFDEAGVRVYDKRDLCRDLVQQIACIYQSGDVRDIGHGDTSEYTPDEPYEDARALYSLIARARDITGVKPDCLIEDKGRGLV